MYLSVSEYDGRERRALAVTPNRIIQAFQPGLFQYLGYQSRVHSETELVKYVDVMHELEFEDDCRLLGGLTGEEFTLLESLARGVAGFTQERFGLVRIPRPSLLRSLNVLRFIRHLFGEARPRVFEAGPGCGYLGAMLMGAGYPYAAVDNTQAFYLYQSHLWSHLTAGRVQERAGDRRRSLQEDLAILEPGHPVHLPWWEFAQAGPGGLGRFDLLVCNRALCEMHPDSLKYFLKMGRAALEGGAGPKALLFDGWGYDLFNSIPDTADLLRRYGFQVAFASDRCNVFIPERQRSSQDVPFLDQLEEGRPSGSLEEQARRLPGNGVMAAINRGEQALAASFQAPCSAFADHCRQTWGEAVLSNPDEDFWTFARNPAPSAVLSALPRNRPLVLFGAGALGRRLKQLLTGLGVESAAFADNDPRKCGQQVEGLAVVAPEAMPPGAFVIICARPGSREIGTQLQAMGLVLDSDFIFG